jgi:hypothetical protein
MTTGFLTTFRISILTLPPTVSFQPQLPAPDARDTLSLEKLGILTWEQLDAIYRRSIPGRAPSGVLNGRAIYDGQQRFAKLRTTGTKAIWLGKEFNEEQGTLINRWRVGRAIKAEVYPGQSWIDGGPALVMDYRETSFVWRNVRDELREVAPGLYLGAMFRCKSSGARFAVFFALQECPQ